MDSEKRASRKKPKPVSAESIARLADRGKDVSRFFTNSGKMIPPVQKFLGLIEPLQKQRGTMAVDREIEWYHLTPRGWEDGGHDSMFSGKHELPRPPDCVETWQDKLDQSSGWSPEQHSWYKTWESPTATEAERAALHKQFPHEYDGRY